MTQPLQAILVEQAIALVRPLTRAAQEPAAREQLVRGLGWDLSALAGFDSDKLAEALATTKAAVDEVAEALAGGLDDLADAVACFVRVRAAVAAVVELVEGWRPVSAPPAMADPPDPAADPYLLLLSDLWCFLLDTHLASRLPRLRVALDVLGVRRVVTAPGPVLIGGRQARDVRPRPFFDVNPLAELLSDPVGVLRSRVFGADPPGTVPVALADLIGPLLVDWLSGVGLRASYGTAGAESPDSGLNADQRVAAAHLLHVTWLAGASSGAPAGEGGGGVQAGLHVAIGLGQDVVPPATTGPLAAVIAPAGTLEAHYGDGAWHVDAALEGTVRPVVASRHGARFVTGPEEEDPGPDARLTGTVEVTYGHPSPGHPALRLGSPAATRLEIDRVRLTMTGTVSATGPTGEVTLSLDGGRLLIEPGSDGFLGAVLPKQPILVALDAGLSWSPERGLTLRGAAGLDQVLPLGYVFGPLTVQQATLSLHAGSSGGVELRLTTDLAVRLGPVSAAVAGLGLRATLAPAGRGATLGPFDLDIGFLPPNGVGIAVDGGVVTGGGSLFADGDTGQYGGIIQLSFLGLSLSAIGLLNTRMPDGSPGFSLLILVSVRFPPVQLGFGFALTGVGGLIGVNRSVDAAALRAGLPDGALDSVLFPADPAANATRLVRDLGRFFPSTAEQYVIGPTVELSWGAQQVLTARLGLFIEFPSPTRVVLAGQLRLALPPGAPEAVVLVQVDLLGVLDFAARTLAIDGALRDSRIAAYTLTGRLAVRAAWGDNPAFLVAVGGFNPRFPQPADFPVLPRLVLALGQGDNPRLRLLAYFAMTSNTVQFGARLEVYASISVPAIGTFAIDAVLSFDALVAIEPLAFVVDIYAMVALAWDGDPLLAVRLEAALSGPQPWRAVGSASFTFLGQYSIDFDVTVGRPLPAAPPRLVNLAEEVRAALRALGNWSAELPARAAPVVTLAETARVDGALLVHPLGSLAVRQNVAPLGVWVDRFGSARIDGDRVFTVDRVLLDGAPATHVDVHDLFAPGEYLDLSDAERLSAPSFDRWAAGFRVDDSALSLPPPAARQEVTARFEDRVVTRVDGRTVVVGTSTATMPDDRMRAQATAGAAALNGATAQGEQAFAAPELGIAVADPRYAVVAAVAPAAGMIAEIVPEQLSLPTYAAARSALGAVASAEPDRLGLLRLVDNDDVPRE